MSSSWQSTLAAAAFGGVLFLFSNMRFSRSYLFERTVMSLEDAHIKMSHYQGEYDFTNEHIFAMEDLTWKKDGLTATKKLCYEDLEPRKSDWLSFMRGVLKRRSPEDQHHTDRYTEILEGDQEGCSLVYLCDAKPETGLPINKKTIRAFMVVQKTGKASVHYPIISLSGKLAPKLEGIMEGFAIRIGIIGDRYFKFVGLSSEQAWSHGAASHPRSDGFNMALTSTLTSYIKLGSKGRYILTIYPGIYQSIQADFEKALRLRLEKCFPADRAASCNFSELALIFKAKYDFDKIFAGLVQKGCFFDALHRINFYDKLAIHHFPAAFKIFAKSESNSFAVVEFISNICYRPSKAELATAADGYLIRLDSLPDEKRDYRKHWDIRKIVCGLQAGDNVPGQLFKLGSDELPDELGNFYCTVNLIAFAAVQYENFELLLFAARLLIAKVHSVRVASPTIFLEESEKALYQGSGLVSRLLKTIAGSQQISRLAIQDLYNPVVLTGLEVLFQEWCLSYKPANEQFLEDSFKFPLNCID